MWMCAIVGLCAFLPPQCIPQGLVHVAGFFPPWFCYVYTPQYTALFLASIHLNVYVNSTAKWKGPRGGEEERSRVTAECCMDKNVKKKKSVERKLANCKLFFSSCIKLEANQLALISKNIPNKFCFGPQVVNLFLVFLFADWCFPSGSRSGLSSCIWVSPRAIPTQTCVTCGSNQLFMQERCMKCALLPTT